MQEIMGVFSREIAVGRLEALKGRLLLSSRVRKGYTGVQHYARFCMQKW